MSYDIAKQRNALPVPADLYGDGSPGTFYDHYDEVSLVPPTDATRAEIRLMYQPTSWEYIQFLKLANDGSNAFLGQEGDNMFDAWANTGMAEPFVMATAAWGSPGEPSCNIENPVLSEALADDKKVTLNWPALTDANVVGYSVFYDQAGKAQWIADSGCVSGQCSYTDLNLTNDQTYCYKLSARAEGCASEFSNILCATPRQPGQQQTAGVTELVTGKWVKQGKGKTATETFVLSATFLQGDSVVFRAQLTDEAGLPVRNATFDIEISGPSSASITSASSDNDGMAGASWNTQAPNRKGQGGTAAGVYTATVSGLAAGGYSWNGEIVQVSVTIEGG
jgi:hypothetical protein